jgi:hypothetical protein
MGRVLRPAGKLIFLELGLSRDAVVRRWQRRWEPVAHWLFEGLHLTRDMPSLLMESGFQIETLETKYLAAFPTSWTCFGGAQHRFQGVPDSIRYDRILRLYGDFKPATKFYMPRNRCSCRLVP